MTISLAGLAREAWVRWRRDSAILLALAGLFLFLPPFASLLLLDQPVLKPDASDTEKFEQLIGWATANLPWLAGRVAVELFGAAAILTLYVSRRHGDVAGVLRNAILLWPAFAAAVLASWGLMTAGFFAFVVPGMYIYGRVCLTGAVLAAEPGAGVFGAIGRSVALTRGHGWQCFGYLTLTLMAGLLAAQLVGGVEDALARAGAANPIALAMLDALAAAAVAAATLVRLLFQVTLYRRLAVPRHGI